MKTAIVKTSFWDDEDFNQLHTDTKLIYTYLLTCPGHGLSGVIKINRNIMVAQTGYNKDTVELALRQLVDAGWILLHSKYVMLTHDHIEAKKGRFTQQAVEQELSDLPLEVREYFYRFGTCTLPEHNNNNKNNNKLNNNTNNINTNNNKVSIYKDDEKEIEVSAKIDPQAVDLAIKLHQLVRERYTFVKDRPKEVPDSAYQIDLLHRKDGYPYELIESVIIWSQNDSFWQQNIRSGSKLRAKFQDLLIRIKSERDNQIGKVTVI